MIDDGLDTRMTQAPLDVVADDTGGVFERSLVHCLGKWDKSTLTNTPICCQFLQQGGGIIRPILTRLHGPFYLGQLLGRFSAGYTDGHGSE